MDKEEKKKAPSNSRLKKLTGYVSDNLANLYQHTYYTQSTNKKDLDKLKTDIDKSIDNIIKNDVNNMSIPNMTKLYTKLQQSQNDRSIIQNIEDVFEDKGLMDNILSSYMENKYLKDQDMDIDTICKYMPKLLEALDTRKDNVLSADHFSKDFITVANDSNINVESSFNKRISEMKKKYGVLKFLEETYDNASKYGEQFVYIVPYKKAIEKLLNNRNNTYSATVKTEECIILNEGAETYKMDKNEIAFSPEESFHLNLEIDKNSMISSVVMAVYEASKRKGDIDNSSLNNILRESVINDKFAADSVKHKTIMDKTMPDDLELVGIYDKETTDGLITGRTDKSKQTVEINGCLVKKLDRASVIPVYIEDMCLGYYYIEFDNLIDPFSSANSNNGLNGSTTGVKGNMLQGENIAKKDQIMKYLSGQLSNYMDAKFINANQDLKNEIYMILKHNDVANKADSLNMRVTFIPPEDMVHVHFKKNPKTHRGISDLERALIPAKLYCCLYVTNTIGVMTRGQDKRVYYVKQNVETNISKTLLNTINQIKKSNFGMRQVDNIDNVLNITGRFNDWIIPLGQSGDAPIQFELMQGQNIEIKTELLSMLEEMAINSTDVPLELIQARQSIDYAVQLTMTNSKFLRKVYNRQSAYQVFCSEIITKIYNSEYGEDDILTVTLPPPMFLNITNTNQVITNTNDFVNSLVEIQMADETDEMVKTIFTKLTKQHYLASYMDIDCLDKLAERARQLAKIKPTQET